MHPTESTELPTAPPEVDDRTDTSNLRSRVGKSSIWTVGGIGAANLIRLFSNVALGWLLVPEHFGVMALVSVFVMGLGMFSDVGVGPCIVQSSRGDSTRFLNTAWTIQISRGFLLLGAAWILAPHFSAFYARGDEGYAVLAELLPVAAFQAVLQGLNSTKIFSAERHFDMAPKIQGDVAGQVVAVVTMITWAAISPTPWALVAGTLAQSATIMLWSHLRIPGQVNRIGFDLSCAKEIFGFGRWIFVSTVITFFAIQIDKLALGTKETDATLGVYHMASSIVNLPQFIGGVLTGTVIFPLLSTYARAQPEELKERFLSQRKTLLLAALLLGLAVVLFSPVFFGLLYPAKYHAAGWMAPMMMIASWFFLLSVTSDRALLALGSPRSLAFANLASLTGKLAGGLYGYEAFGLPGYIVGLALGTLLGQAVVQYSLAKLELPILVQDLRYTAVAAAVGLTGYLLWRFLGVHTMGTGPLLIQGAIGVALCGPLGYLLFQRIRAVGMTG